MATSKTKKTNPPKKITIAGRFSRITLLIFTLVFANIGLLTLVFTYAATAGYSWSAETDQFNRINGERNRHGTKSLTRSKCLTDAARLWAKRMATNNTLAHSSGSYYYVSQIDSRCGKNWSGVAENVGKSYVSNNNVLASSASVFNAYLSSSSHHANIDRTTYDFVGTAAYKSANNYLWTVHLFADCNGCSGAWSTAPTRVGEPTTVSTTSQPSSSSGDHFVRGFTMRAGDSVKSSNGSYILIMQSDGNLVIYRSGSGAIWSSRTNGSSGASAIFQSDSNFVVYRSGKSPCHSSTTNSGGTIMYMQNDGNLVMYSSSGQAVWDSKGYTGGRWYCS
jgi:hypothetical protein